MTDRVRNADQTPLQALASDMIERAWLDMMSDGITNERLSALAWLVSRQAGPWYDALGIDQRWLLEKVEWSRHAERFWTQAKQAYKQKGWNRNHLRVTRRGMELYRRGIL